MCILSHANAAAKPVVKISYPPDGAFIRANVPVFGVAHTPGEEGGLKQWFLEYGAGRNPTQWTRIKQSETPESHDPNAHGEVVWNVDKEPEGNLTNWAVGLTSYKYARWSKNLNGIYTLRLVAESRAGERAETRQTYYIGEAIIRLHGGTTVSADMQCRLTVPAFSFGGEQARVVALIKQMPPEECGRCKTVTGVEETDAGAAEIYRLLPADFQILSAIYRLYPTGLQTDPAALLEMELDGREFTPPGSAQADMRDGALLYQWDAGARLWVPFKTQWIGNTARAQAPAFGDQICYVVLMRRVRPLECAPPAWQELSALSGHWVGSCAPCATVQVSAPEGTSAQCESDAHGAFRLPFRLQPGSQLYRFTFIPAEGTSFASTAQVRQKSGEVLLPQAPVLSVPGGDAVCVNEKLTISCQDSTLNNNHTSQKRSLLAQVQTRDGSKRATVELAETLPGSGNFMGVLLPESVETRKQAPLEAVFPPQLAHGQTLSISVGNATILRNVQNTQPPQITLSSVTHPCFLFANPQTGARLRSSQTHSQCDIRVERGANAWRIGPPPQNIASARIAAWPMESFPVASWPFIGFTYKLQRQAPWQLIVRGDAGMASFHFACKEAWLPAYAPVDPLTADGGWHDWQQSLQHPKFQQIDSLAFGSWIKTGFHRVEAGFPANTRDSIQIKDLWIGRSYRERLVEMQWSIQAQSPPARIEWWVDRQADSAPPAPAAAASGGSPLAKTLTGVAAASAGKCTFQIPEDGKWFFHMVAVDQAGNASAPANYPLLLYSAQGAAEAGVERLLQPAAQEIAWELPEGSFQLKLSGCKTSLNPRKLALRIGETAYPLPHANWNAAAETLTLNAKAFGQTRPLCFDKETLNAKLEAQDLNGKPIPNLPELRLRITSPFQWTSTPNGGTLKIAQGEQKTSWIAFWKNPEPPWMQYFPQCVNNTLVITGGWKPKQWPPPPHWQRPILLQPADTEPIHWEEQWSDPVGKLVPLHKTPGKLLFSAQGYLQPAPGAPKTPVAKSPEKTAWIYRQTPADPFEPGTLRLISRLKSGEITMERASALDIKNALARQNNNSLRLDGWLARGEGYLYLKAPGKRKILFATSAEQPAAGASAGQATAGAGRSAIGGQPAPGAGQPAANTWQATAGAGQPSIGGQPALGTRQPTTNTWQPAAGTGQPVTGVAQSTTSVEHLTYRLVSSDELRLEASAQAPWTRFSIQIIPAPDHQPSSRNMSLIPSFEGKFYW